MSRKTSKKAPAPSARPVTISLRDLMGDPIDRAVEKVMQWPARCPGPCFPLVFRWWDA